MKNKTDKEIAELFLKTIKAFEESWSEKEQRYLAGSHGGRYVRKRLQEEEMEGGFAKMLEAFCVCWLGDCESICREICK